MARPEDILRVKALLPTTLGSEEIRERIAADILRRSVFSARMASMPYLAELREVLAQYAGGAVNRADATLALTRSLERLGHSPMDGNAITNPASQQRLDLILKTNRQMAASVARIEAQTPDTLDDFPGWELMRFSGRRVPREDWHRRWAAAGDAVGWQGAARHTGEYPEWSFIALKNSPIWAALGSGAGGFRDTLGNPYPPFAHGSGLDWDDVERDRCEALGILQPGQIIQMEKVSLAPDGAEVYEMSQRYGIDFGEDA